MFPAHGLFLLSSGLSRRGDLLVKVLKQEILGDRESFPIPRCISSCIAASDSLLAILLSRPGLFPAPAADHPGIPGAGRAAMGLFSLLQLQENRNRMPDCIIQKKRVIFNKPCSTSLQTRPHLKRMNVILISYMQGAAFASALPPRPWHDFCLVFFKSSFICIG
jgi:hypothetical protein